METRAWRSAKRDSDAAEAMPGEAGWRSGWQERGEGQGSSGDVAQRRTG